MFVTENQYGPARLRVVRRRCVLDSVFDEPLEGGIGDGRLGRKVVTSPAGLVLSAM